MLLLAEMKTREAYKHYLSLEALTPCVSFPPWPTFRWWYLTEKERGALRIRGTTQLTLLISFTQQPFSTFSHPILCLSERLTQISCARTWFPFPLSSLAHCSLYFDFAPFAILLSSAVYLPESCHAHFLLGLMST